MLKVKLNPVNRLGFVTICGGIAICLQMSLAGSIAFAQDRLVQAQSGVSAAIGEAPAEGVEQAPEVELDQHVKIKVEPLLVGRLIDRLVGPATITVEGCDAQMGEVWLLPIDAPYGGKVTGKPIFLGRAHRVERRSAGARVLVLKWHEPLSHDYVRIFAVVYPRKTPDKPVRSVSLDLAISGSMYVKPPASSPLVPPVQP